VNLPDFSIALLGHRFVGAGRVFARQVGLDLLSDMLLGLGEII
jgi:hypothetical protein